MSSGEEGYWDAPAEDSFDWDYEEWYQEQCTKEELEAKVKGLEELTESYKKQGEEKFSVFVQALEDNANSRSEPRSLRMLCTGLVMDKIKALVVEGEGTSELKQESKLLADESKELIFRQWQRLDRSEFRDSIERSAALLVHSGREKKRSSAMREGFWLDMMHKIGFYDKDGESHLDGNKLEDKKEKRTKLPFVEIFYGDWMLDEVFGNQSFSSVDEAQDAGLKNIKLMQDERKRKNEDNSNCFWTSVNTQYHYVIY